MYTYSEELEKTFIAEAEGLDASVREVIKAAMRSAEKALAGDPWSEGTARFVVSPAGGVADYVYDNEAKARFRAPMGVVMPVLIKRGDVVLLEGPGKIIRRQEVISELERRLSMAKKELEQVERKLKKRKSKWLEEQRELWKREVAKIAMALEYLSSP
jgi:hypothetical protein